MTLFTIDSVKTLKGEKKGIKTLIMYLLPHRQNSQNINLCPHASEGCAKACLVGSGNAMFPAVMQARANRTEFYIKDRFSFLVHLKKEIEDAIKKYEKDFQVVVRLNGTSDVQWERFDIFDGKNIFECFPNTQFYDYTKSPNRFDKKLPDNYHLTFSRSESNHEIAMAMLARGVNVAMVFAGKKLPAEYEGYKVIDGDVDDLRFLDEKGGVIVGLVYKKLTGKGANNKAGIESGFVIDLTNPTPVMVAATSCGK